MSRKATELELAAFRSDGQATELYAAILKPATVYACRVNQTFASNDKIAQFVYNRAVGTRANVLAGMTVYIGTSAGAWDVGICRVRKAWDHTIAYIGETSEISWANNLYVTVVDDMRLWRRDVLAMNDGGIKIDYDNVYIDQHRAFAPVVCMGPHAVAWLVDGSAQITFDASASWCLSSGAKSYSWAASAGSWSSTSSATPTLTVSAYTPYIRVACTVSVGWRSSTSYRYILLFDADHPPYSVKSAEIGGDFGDGGWNFSLTFYDEIRHLPPNPLVVLFARDWYAGQEVSYGAVAGRENVIAWGWAGDEELSDRAQYGQVELNVYGPHWWMDNMTYPVGVELFDTVESDNWKQVPSLTVDKALYHLLHFRSTATAVMDIFLSGDTRQAPTLSSQAGTLWEQINDISDKKIMARPCCNRYGQLYVQIDAQVLPMSERADVPVVMTLQKQNWRGELEVTRRLPRSAHVALATIQHVNGNTSTLYSLSPGHVPAGRGRTRIADGYLAATQTQSNAMCGLMVAAENVAYQFRIQVAANNRIVDICPRQYIKMDIAAADTPCGLEYYGNAIVREILFDWQESGFLAVAWEAESASVIIPGIDGDIPLEDGGSVPMPPGPDFGGIKIPPLPPGGGGDGEGATDSAPAYAMILMEQNSSSRGLYYTKNFNTSAPTWYAMNFGLTQDDIDGFYWFGLNRAGRVYVASQKDIWSGIIGGLLKKFYTAPTDEFIRGMNCNPLLADSLMAIVGRSYPGETSNVFTGSSAILTQKGTLTWPSAFEGGTLSYGAGKWLWTHTRGVGSTGTIHRISASGTEEYYGTIDSFGGQDHFHCRAGTSDLILHVIGNKRYTNGGETATALGQPAIINRPMGAALSPDGVRVIAVGDDGRLRKSSDGGLTWSLVPIDVIGAFQYLSAVDSVDANRFAFAASSFGGIPPGRVYYTPDFGATWVEKTGNLREIAGLGFRPWYFKMIG